MNILKRNLNTVVQIIVYCEDISKAVKRFGNSYDTLIHDKDYKNTVSMCIFQIGELSVSLTDDFKEKYNGVPWREIKGMRNVVAHEYIKMKDDVLWKVICDDIPKLREYCEKILRENNVEEYPV